MRKTPALLKVLKPVILSSTLILSSLALADKPEFPGVTLPEQANGQRAIQLLGGKLPDVAAWYGMTTAEFAKTLRTDPSAWIDTKGHLFYIEEEVTGSTTTPQVAEASYPYADTFKLHSKPGANQVIYLDFTGYTISGHAWASGATVDSPAFSWDTDTANFSTSEMDTIQEVWKRVAEDYAPFDVDVTTEDPGADAINRSSSSDQNYGTRAVITAHDSRLCSSCGGVAYVGVFDLAGSYHEYYQPAFVFYDKLYSAKNIAEAASHEVGHNLGLSHDGTSVTGYYTGQGSGATSWSPIMGVGYYTELSQWSKGEYADANQLQDDYLIMQQNGLAFVADDHLSGLDASATDLTVSAGATSGTSTVSGSGIISEQSDKDVFKFESGAGAININVDAAAVGANLDIEASLYNSAGTLLTTSNPTDAINASISLSGQPAGIYYLEIDGVGKGDAYVDGYTDYGSLGRYTISGTIPEASGLQAPVAAVTHNATAGIAPMTVNFDASGSTDADGSIVSYSWNFGDGSSATGASASHVFNAPGDYNVSLTVTDNDGLTGSTSTSISVDNQAPVAVANVSSTTGTAPLTVTFSSAGSSDPDAAHSLSYSWNFGDGSSSTSANPSHQYTAAGNYTATLTVTDDLGATDTASVGIVVEADLNTPPAAPTNLTAQTVVSGRGKTKTVTASLSWTDNSDNEDNFVIEICEETGSRKNKTCDYTGALDVTVGANVTTYDLGTLSGTHQYRVKAVNANGESATSNEVKL